ncbi:MAG TPA: N-formylglutamate amidohydrolase [Casimicrobiaceae bacterium]|jgi:N-formylglutamate deformylase
MNALEGVWRRHDPTVEAIPLVFDSPHSGEIYPADFHHSAARNLVRQAEDTHVARLWSRVTAVGATLIEAQFPRAYIDPNRSLADIDPALLADAWDEPLTPSRKTVQGIGLVWRIVSGGVPLYARKLSAAELRGRIDRYYAPYHGELDAIIDARHRRFGAVWHVDCHSMPAVGDVYADDPGRERCDFVIGDRDGTTCEAAFTRFVADTLEAIGYSVAVNDPYKGVEIVRRHGRPEESRHSVQIEIKRTLYMDEKTLAPNGGYGELERNLRTLAAALADYVRGRVSSIGR